MDEEVILWLKAKLDSEDKKFAQYLLVKLARLNRELTEAHRRLNPEQMGR